MLLMLLRATKRVEDMIRKKGDERHGKAGYEGEAKGDAWHQFSPDRKATALVDAIFAPR